MTDRRWDLAYIDENLSGSVKEEGSSPGFEWILISSDDLLDFCTEMKMQGYNLLTDVSSVDMSAKGISPRFIVVFNLFSLEKKTRLVIKVAVDEDESIPSVTSVWPGANWMESEVYDLMGIEFSGHPNLERILTYEGLSGYPLRKDFPVRARNVPWERPE